MGKQITKKELQEENGLLKGKLSILASKDLELRTSISEMLDSFEFEKEPSTASFYWNPSKAKRFLKVQEWLGIAFLIGELKADANYSIILQARDELRMENEQLRKTIQELDISGRDKSPSMP